MMCTKDFKKIVIDCNCENNIKYWFYYYFIRVCNKNWKNNFCRYVSIVCILKIPRLEEEITAGLDMKTVGLTLYVSPTYKSSYVV